MSVMSTAKLSMVKTQAKSGLHYDSGLKRASRGLPTVAALACTREVGAPSHRASEGAHEREEQEALRR
jgi:hypothetical protein